MNGPGFLDGGDTRIERGLPEGGPKLVFSPLGVFDFEPTTKRMRVRSLHPGATIEQVQAQTGFEMLVDGKLPITALPTPNELKILREKVDTSAALRHAH